MQASTKLCKVQQVTSLKFRFLAETTEIGEIVDVVGTISRMTRFLRIIGGAARFLGEIGIALMVVNFVVEVAVGEVERVFPSIISSSAG